MGFWDIVLLIFAIVAALGIGLYFLNRWAYKRMGDQQSMIERTKQPATIYIIDKAKVKASESSLPKAVQEQLPRIYKFMKMPLVKAKVGPQIVTLMCDKAVFEALPLKKSVKVELAGMYIVSMAGMKTKQERAQEAKAKGKPQNTSVLSSAMDKLKSIGKKK